jgi:ABC-type transporter Mla MlaB component
MGVSQGVVYIINETDQELIALMWNERTKQFQGLGYRNIAADLSSVQRVRP